MHAHAYASRGIPVSAERRGSSASKAENAAHPRRTFVQFPPWIIRSMHLFHGIQFKILTLIAFKNGFSDASKEFSVRYIAVKTGEPKSTVHFHLRKMIDAGFVRISGRGKRGILRLEIPADGPLGLLDIGGQATTTTVPTILVTNVQASERSPSRQPGQLTENQHSVPSQEEPVWLSTKALLQQSIPEAFFRLFIEPIRARIEGTRLILACDNTLTKHFENRYLPQIRELVRANAATLAYDDVVVEPVGRSKATAP